jgi:hypothetical protein
VSSGDAVFRQIQSVARASAANSGTGAPTQEYLIRHTLESFLAADVVAAWHGHTERMTQAVYGRVTDDRLTAASAVFAASAVGQS